jgi:thiol peroxidase
MSCCARVKGRGFWAKSWQLLSAHRGEQFAQDYGVWLNQGRQLARAVFVLDRANRIAYAEYVANPLCEPDYAAALQAVRQLEGERES